MELTKNHHVTMKGGFSLFLFSYISLLFRKYRITPFFVYSMFIRPAELNLSINIKLISHKRKHLL